MERNDKPQITEYLANEQTYLAWLRTGVEVMAFGFVAIKFALFASKVMGILLIGVGTIMILLAYFRYRKTVTQLRNGKFVYSGTLIAITAVVVFVLCAALLYCLLDSGKTNPKQKIETEY
jgi:putative membrane protein